MQPVQQSFLIGDFTGFIIAVFQVPGQSGRITFIAFLLVDFLYRDAGRWGHDAGYPFPRKIIMKAESAEARFIDGNNRALGIVIPEIVPQHFIIRRDG